MGDLTFEKLCFNWSGCFFLDAKLALICYVPKSKSPNNMGVVAPDIGSISPWVRSPPSRIDPKQRRQGSTQLQALHIQLATIGGTCLGYIRLPHTLYVHIMYTPNFCTSGI